MDKCNFNSFEDIMKACGYSFDEEGNIDWCSFDEDSYIGCKDMTGGFQSVYPQLFVLVGEVIGAIISEKIPINEHDSFVNWLQLIGQVILTYNAQQQYFQGDPGRYFNPKYYNVTNPFCNATPTNTTQNNNPSNDSKNSSKSKEKNSNTDYNIKSSSQTNVDKIEMLELRINQLTAEMERIKNKMEQ